MSALHEIDDRAWEREQARERRAEALGRPVLVPNEAPPPCVTIASPPPRPGVVPAVRLELINYARANPGLWLRYEPGDRETIKITTLRTYIDVGSGGFGPGFEAAGRGGDLYVRYTEPNGGWNR